MNLIVDLGLTSILIERVRILHFLLPFWLGMTKERRKEGKRRNVGHGTCTCNSIQFQLPKCSFRLSSSWEPSPPWCSQWQTCVRIFLLQHCLWLRLIPPLLPLFWRAIFTRTAESFASSHRLFHLTLHPVHPLFPPLNVSLFLLLSSSLSLCFLLCLPLFLVPCSVWCFPLPLPMFQCCWVRFIRMIPQQIFWFLWSLKFPLIHRRFLFSPTLLINFWVPFCLSVSSRISTQWPFFFGIWIPIFSKIKWEGECSTTWKSLQSTTMMAICKAVTIWHFSSQIPQIWPISLPFQFPLMLTIRCPQSARMLPMQKPFPSIPALFGCLLFLLPSLYLLPLFVFHFFWLLPFCVRLPHLLRTWPNQSMGQ